MAYISDFTGTAIDNAVAMNTYKSLTDVNTFDQGIYYCSSGTSLNNLTNKAFLPETLKADASGFIMIVRNLIGLDDNRASAIIIPNQMPCLYIGRSNIARTSWESWYVIKGDSDFGTIINPVKGTTAQRPSIANYGVANKKQYYGYKYIDTDLHSEVLSWEGTEWLDMFGFSAAPHVGPTENRPATLNPARDIGFQYFDTTINKPIWAVAIDSQTGIVTWKDANNTNV